MMVNNTSSGVADEKIYPSSTISDVSSCEMSSQTDKSTSIFESHLELHNGNSSTTFPSCEMSSQEVRLTSFLEERLELNVSKSLATFSTSDSKLHEDNRSLTLKSLNVSSDKLEPISLFMLIATLVLVGLCSSMNTHVIKTRPFFAKATSATQSKEKNPSTAKETAIASSLTSPIQPSELVGSILSAAAVKESFISSLSTDISTTLAMRHLQAKVDDGRNVIV